MDLFRWDFGSRNLFFLLQHHLLRYFLLLYRFLPQIIFIAKRSCSNETHYVAKWSNTTKLCAWQYIFLPRVTCVALVFCCHEASCGNKAICNKFKHGINTYYHKICCGNTVFGNYYKCCNIIYLQHNSSL